MVEQGKLGKVNDNGDFVFLAPGYHTICTLGEEYLGEVSKINNSPEIFFLYLLNVFLDEFCDYGTNPLKSIIMSFYVLIGFSIVYLIFAFKNESNENIKRFHGRYGHLRSGIWYTRLVRPLWIYLL